MTEPALLIRELRSRCPGLALLENEPLSRHCSFRIGGPCAALVSPASPEEAETVCRVLRESGAVPLVIGNGTNLLVADGPLPRIVLRMGDDFARMERRGDRRVFAQSGVTLSRLAAAAGEWGLAGLEFAHGIPGTLGGAVSMNAGAYGGEMTKPATKM